MLNGLDGDDEAAKRKIKLATGVSQHTLIVKHKPELHERSPSEQMVQRGILKNCGVTLAALPGAVDSPKNQTITKTAKKPWRESTPSPPIQSNSKAVEGNTSGLSEGEVDTITSAIGAGDVAVTAPSTATAAPSIGIDPATTIAPKSSRKDPTQVYVVALPKDSRVGKAHFFPASPTVQQGTGDILQFPPLDGRSSNSTEPVVVITESKPEPKRPWWRCCC